MRLLQVGSPGDIVSGYLLVVAGPVALGLSLAMAAGPVAALTWFGLGWLAWTSNRLTGVGFLAVIGYLVCVGTEQSPDMATMLTAGTLLAFGLSSTFELIFELYGQRSGSRPQDD